MKYTLLYTKSAAQDIQKLDSVTKKRIGKKLKEYIADPLRYAKRLINADIGAYRWRIGNFRVIFDIDKNNIIILRIGHRREIYT